MHDTPSLVLPYLPDVIAAGVAVSGIPGRTEPLVVPYTGTAWPDYRPSRIVVEAGLDANASLTGRIAAEGGRSVLILTVPPGLEAELTLTTAIRADRLAQLDRGTASDKVVLSGAHPGLSAPMRITVVHAVRTPVTAPRVVNPTVSGDRGRLDVTVGAAVDAHAGSTGQLDLEASWTEVVDPGSGDLMRLPRRAPLGRATVAVDPPSPGVARTPMSVVHHTGDTRSRRLSVSAVASSRHREYFTSGRIGGQVVPLTGPDVAVTIPNRAVPPPPVIDAVVPTFRWTRTATTSGELSRTRSTAGFRIWLRRTWLESGEGEQLGVVLPTSTTVGAAALAQNKPIADLVTRWGADPLEETGPAAVGHLAASDFGFAAGNPVVRAFPLVDAVAAGSAALILPYDVQFDRARDLWFADVDLAVTATAWPFVRLALVRYQPHSVPGCEISRVTLADFCQLPPIRTVKLSRVGAFGVRAKFSGTVTRNSSFTLRQERMLVQPLAAATDLGSDAGVGPAQGWTVTPETPAFNEMARLHLDWTGAGQPPTDVVAALRAGRVVVEEHQAGITVLGGAPTFRVVFTETIDRTAIGMG